MARGHRPGTARRARFVGRQGPPAPGQSRSPAGPGPKDGRPYDAARPACHRSGPTPFGPPCPVLPLVSGIGTNARQPKRDHSKRGWPVSPGLTW